MDPHFSLAHRNGPQQSGGQVDCDRGPGEPADHPGALRIPQAPGAELEAAGAPQPQDRFLRHHLGVAAGGGMFDV